MLLLIFVLFEELFFFTKTIFFISQPLTILYLKNFLKSLIYFLYYHILNYTLIIILLSFVRFHLIISQIVFKTHI